MSASDLARQARLVAALRDCAHFPHPVAAIEVVETHISWVILTGRFAYKIKKAVDLGFLDFTTLTRREHFCREELRLNRRLAPDWYLDVVPITGDVDAPRIAGAGEAIEWAVRMREFERGAEISRLLPSGVVTPVLIDEIADRIAAFHASCPRDTAPDGFGAPEAVYRPIRNNFATLQRRLADPGMRAMLERLRVWSEEQHRRLVPTLAERRSGGFIREVHGDLHLGNIALQHGQVLIFDCIEFHAGLRWVDVMSEIAFPVMDLTHRGRPDFARRLLNRYLERSGDYAGVAVLRYYLVYRALVRASVAAIRGGQGESAEHTNVKIRGYLACAQRLAHGGPLALLITHGVAGSGKTTVTSALLEAVDVVRIRSDVERKRLAGLAAESRSASAIDGGLYTAQAKQRTYETLRALAAVVLRAGYPVMLDATFLDRGERDACRACARAAAAAFHILACRARADTLRERVARRSQAGQDASEADLAVLARQLEAGSELDADELAQAIAIDTSQPVDAPVLAAMLGMHENPQDH